MQDEDNYPENTRRRVRSILRPTFPQMESAGNRRFDLKKTLVLRTLVPQTHHQASVMRHDVWCEGLRVEY